MATRTLRWVEASKGGKTPFRWNQLKQHSHPSKEGRTLDVPTDRTLDFSRRVEGKKGRVYKVSKKVREELQAKAEEVIALLQKIASGTVTNFHFNTGTGVVQYTQELTVEGEKFSEGESTDDETVIEAAESLVALLVSRISTKAKPVVPWEPAEPLTFSEDIEEPEEE